ncbi:hypothetical protein [Endomicrobium proavitum]|uniref:CBM11 domain-containing protein n=1 Tax=Endomicrobium proavitum TaxID=1408281 RepID=A0A0G3WJG5_9BACT|nr:hypothetical protein [Endomicrobium proavitum]AKL97997.1 conserved exported protein of unknown function [Endomicrobium proavitum]
MKGLKMKKAKLLILSVLAFGFICIHVSSVSAAKTKTVSTNLSPQERAELAFYVYADNKSVLNHYSPSGWMGDSKDLIFNQEYRKDVYAGKTCIQVKYTPKGGNRWVGIYWQQPANNWGSNPDGYDLNKATFITFWAKGETGSEVISEVKIGGFKGDYPDSGSAFKKNIKLTQDWKLYHIDLRKTDLTRIAGGFSFTVTKKDNPNGATFYLDEIRYEMEK